MSRNYAERSERRERVKAAVVGASEKSAGKFLADWHRRHRKALARVRRMVDGFKGGDPLGYAPRAHYGFRVLCSQLRTLAVTYGRT